jgi:hypothetical protein
MLLAWAGPVGLLLVFAGLALAGFIPPPSPGLTQSQTIELWRHHPDLKRAGMILCLWGGTLYVPFAIAITLAMRRIPGDRGILSTAQAALGVFGTVFYSVNFLILATIPFRPDAPQVSLHDLGFIFTFAPAQPFVFQYLVIGIAILQDTTNRPVFPRWVAYLNFWVAVGLLPPSLIPFFRSGPLAWNGILGFWIPAAVFVSWFAVMFPFLRRAAAIKPYDSVEPGRSDILVNAGSRGPITSAKGTP